MTDMIMSALRGTWMNSSHWKFRIVYWVQLYLLLWPLFVLPPLTWWQYAAWALAAVLLTLVIGKWSRQEIDLATEALRRASFRKGRIDLCTWVLYALEGHYISVGKAAEWLRDWIHKGTRGVLPEELIMLDEESMQRGLDTPAWIDVSERLPEPDTRVVYRYEGGDFIGRFHNGTCPADACFGGKSGVLTGDVTYWFPMPPEKKS